jgi:hypothetical protein
MAQLTDRIHDSCCRAWDAAWPLRRPLVSRVEYNFKMWMSQAAIPQPAASAVACNEGIATIFEELVALREEVETLAQRMERLPARREPWPNRLVFLHVPKTGGTALGAFAKSHFPPEEIAVVANERNLVPAMLEKRYFSGHVGAHVLDGLAQPAVTLTVLREPVERALSEYSYRRTAKPHPDTPADEVAEFYRAQAWTIEEYARQGTGNAVTTMLGGENGSDAERLARARERLLRLEVVGVHERLWEAAVMLCLRMGWTFPGEIAPANVTSDRIREADVQPEVIEAIRARDHLDVRLYAFANELAQERWKQSVASMVNRLCD